MGTVEHGTCRQQSRTERNTGIDRGGPRATAGGRSFRDYHGIVALKHRPEKWAPVFGKDHAQTKRQSGMTIRKKSHRALAAMRYFA
jgi:hypothetical protein